MSYMPRHINKKNEWLNCADSYYDKHSSINGSKNSVPNYSPISAAQEKKMWVQTRSSV